MSIIQVSASTNLAPILYYSYDEILKDYEVTYVAGGASQNAARGAAVSILGISLNQ